MRKCGEFMFLASFFIFLALAVPAVSAADCELFYEDFSGDSIHTWDFFGDPYWSIENGTMVLTDPEEYTVAETSFVPGEPFVMDVDVVDYTFSEEDKDCYFGLYAFTEGDGRFTVEGEEVDGVTAVVWPIDYEDACLGVWDTSNQEWITADCHVFPVPLTSFGISISETELVLRLNKENTPVKFSGDFSAAAPLIDTVWLRANCPGMTLRLDNLCAQPLSEGGYDGIWKDAGPTMNFYVQTYAPGSVIVIATPNLSDFYVFLDSDVSDGVDVDDLAGAGHHLSLTFSSPTEASATMTLAGSAAKNYAIAREFRIPANPDADGIWKSPSCDAPTRNLYVQTYAAGSGIAIVTSDLQEFMVFLDSDTASGFEAEELSGKPFHLSLGFSGSPPEGATTMSRCVAAPQGVTSEEMNGYVSLYSIITTDK